jgi:hypothetical protein
VTRLVALAVPVVLGLGALAVGRPPVPQDQAVKGKYLSDANLGAQCTGCHRAPNEDNKDRTNFVFLYESAYWREHDMHHRAFAALTSEVGRRMSERLWGSPEAAAAKADCLVCHATDFRPKADLTDSTVDKPGTPGRFGCEQGVNCQSCHGPGLEAWRAGHQDLEWRKMTPAQKQVQGLVNLRDPAVRAEKCASCHVGSAAEHKFVTHAMYAAGHPPLPAFELATFSRDEPRHWRQPAAVEHILGLPPAQAKELFSYRPGEVEAARLAAVGAVTALRETAKLAATAPDNQPLDFAHFNCSACHHELVVPSDRQKNGFPGAAGRPVPTTWPVWATRAVLRHESARGAGDGFAPAYEAWRKAFDAAPFGDRDKVKAAAAGLEAACAGLLKTLDGATFDEKSARSLITALTAEASETGGRRDYLDADGAGQLARAVACIMLELRNPPKPGPTRPEPPPPLTFTGTADRRLNDLIGLAVRESAAPPPDKDGKRPPLPLLQDRGTYADRARRAFNYRVTDLRSALAQFAGP